MSDVASAGFAHTWAIRVSDEMLQAIQDEGTCWMSGSTWNGEPVVRISVCNWRTTEDDIRRSAEAIEACLAQPLLAKK